MNALNQKYLPQYTYADYKQWEGRWELIYGVPYAMSPAPVYRHQRINTRIVAQLTNALENCHTCEATIYVDYKISENTVLQPDALVICGPFEYGLFITKAPAIVFEILSPSTRLKDMNLKYEIYEREGVKYYVIVDPVKTSASVYLISDGKYELVLTTSDGSFDFDIEPCPFSFDFAKIW